MYTISPPMLMISIGIAKAAMAHGLVAATEEPPQLTPPVPMPSRRNQHGTRGGKLARIPNKFL